MSETVVRNAFGVITTDTGFGMRFYSATPYGQSTRAFPNLRAALDHLDAEGSRRESAEQFVRKVLQEELKQGVLPPEVVAEVALQVLKAVPRLSEVCEFMQVPS